MLEEIKKYHVDLGNIQRNRKCRKIEKVKQCIQSRIQNNGKSKKPQTYRNKKIRCQI